MYSFYNNVNDFYSRKNSDENGGSQNKSVCLRETRFLSNWIRVFVLIPKRIN